MEYDDFLTDPELFVLTLFDEEHASARLAHLPSGEHTVFDSFDEMLAFLVTKLQSD